MAAEGVTISGTCLNSQLGLGTVNAEITASEDGICSITGTATVTNENIKNILSNDPRTVIVGDQVTVTDVEFKHTTEGIAAIDGLAEGIIVKYDAKVGDTYKTDDGERTVTAVYTEDDYMWGFMLIKVIAVEGYSCLEGVKKIQYWANHRFGLVGIRFTFDDESIAHFPVYISTDNG